MIIQRKNIICMKKQKQDIRKKYISPEIERIELDNEISLALESDAPFGPNEEVLNNTPNFIKNDHFKSTLV